MESNFFIFFIFMKWNLTLKLDYFSLLLMSFNQSSILSGVHFALCIAVSQESTFTHIFTNEFLHRSRKTQTIDEVLNCSNFLFVTYNYHITLFLVVAYGFLYTSDHVGLACMYLNVKTGHVGFLLRLAKGLQALMNRLLFFLSSLHVHSFFILCPPFF